MMEFEFVALELTLFWTRIYPTALAPKSTVAETIEALNMEPCTATLA